MNGKMSPDVIIEWIEGTKNPNSIKIDIILPSHDYLDQSRDVIKLPTHYNRHFFPLAYSSTRRKRWKIIPRKFIMDKLRG